MVGVQVNEWYNVGDEAGNVRHVTSVIKEWQCIKCVVYRKSICLL